MLWLLFSDKGKTIIGIGKEIQPGTPILEASPTSHTPANPLHTSTTKIVKNASGNGLLLITTNSNGGTSTKALTFDEAAKFLGTAATVCGIVKYEECTRIRM